MEQTLTTRDLQLSLYELKNYENLVLLVKG